MFKVFSHFVQINLVNDLHSCGGLIYNFLVRDLEFFQSKIGRLFFKSVGTRFDSHRFVARSYTLFLLFTGFHLQIGFKPGSLFYGFLIRLCVFFIVIRC
ncbi:hypothetical protein Hanom_Chr16g01478341 [Helianthus anomalus]